MIWVLATFFVLLAIGVPIGYVLGIAGVLGIMQIGGSEMLAMAPQRYFAGLDLFTFLAMPLFIFAGELMNRAGITDRLAKFADSLVGHLRGGMAQSCMVSSVLFAGITGAAVAEAAAFGSTMVPAMEKNGYRKPFACGVVIAGSIIGPTIPPSNLMVIYGSMMGVSIAGLFAAGILPGLIMGLVVMVVIAALGRRLNLPKGGERPSLLGILTALRASLAALVMPVIILGGIIGGFVTPTEGAAIAVFYALLLGLFVFRTVRLGDIEEMLVRTARVTGVVFLIIAAASILSWWMTYMKLPQLITGLFLGLTSDPSMIILMILALLLVLGMFMDINAILIILGPILGALAMSIGMDPVQAGIMIVLALNIGLMTPPVGASLFVLSSITGARIEQITAAMWPFVITEVAVLFLVAYWPRLTLTMPRLMGL
ncbi:MAG TPA: C4-dicarboxylate ABC transporter permease [Rhodocyclaceae bacterium]|nr:MAG: C4-dicarboxylate ABC transporter permease [Betaproteobacteria bacterium CG2_30_68_42]PIX75250.1 MAG: C4-dicarboxylate ABC transporter permease [Rhodocyclales bacterium CG_4_10_14_3_um_filter_68_10]PJA58731.1 MAG: C4-dicarboxylate ABC transporter permease [Rhodocyclales bacterium CG_4_9_14_3_um_filter_68_10]HCX34186.1 C4-dicarboxylate ABC transporter permease [Rhodocyclaceae bacterium]